MALTLCPNCRLPVNDAAHRCPLCTAPLESATGAATRRVPVAAAVALLATATVAMLARRLA